MANAASVTSTGTVVATPATVLGVQYRAGATAVDGHEFTDVEKRLHAHPLGRNRVSSPSPIRVKVIPV